jgi:hypothetical protein
VTLSPGMVTTLVTRYGSHDCSNSCGFPPCRSRKPQIAAQPKSPDRLNIGAERLRCWSDYLFPSDPSSRFFRALSEDEWVDGVLVSEGKTIVVNTCGYALRTQTIPSSYKAWTGSLITTEARQPLLISTRMEDGRAGMTMATGLDDVSIQALKSSSQVYSLP